MALPLNPYGRNEPPPRPDPRLRNPWGPWSPSASKPMGLPLPPGVPGKSGMHFNPWQKLDTRQITDLRHNAPFRNWLTYQREVPRLARMSDRAYFDYLSAWYRAHPQPPMPSGVPINPKWWRTHYFPTPQGQTPSTYGQAPYPLPLPRR